MTEKSDNLFEFTALFNRYKTRLYNYVLKMTSDRMNSEDIIQNVFMKLHENLGSIRDRESIVFWLFTTARNEVYTSLRRKKLFIENFVSAQPDELELGSGHNLSAELELNEMKDLIRSELGKISAEQREVFILKEYGGLSYKEIASLMDIDENLVKSRLYNVRQKLIDKISKVI